MIEAFSWRGAHLVGDAFAAQARLRHRVFVERRGLPHDSFGGLEYDAFDTPAAIYLVWRDEAREARGLIRLLPTTRPYMLQTCWPEMIETGEPPVSPRIWEITRVCVDRTVPAATRLRIMPEMLCGVAEFFELAGISEMIGLTRPHLVSHYIPDGVRWLGPVAEIEGEQEQAFLVGVEHIRPRAHLSRHGIAGSVLRWREAGPGEAAAA